MACLVQADLTTSANAVLFPLAGILVGLSFAWAGNAQALLQSTEIVALSEHHEGGFVEYVYVYQTAILVILITLVAWGIAGLGVFDNCSLNLNAPVTYLAIKWILFSLCSLTIRECWHVVLGAQWMLLAQRKIKWHEEERKKNRK
jgi:hypothetical protein